MRLLNSPMGTPAPGRPLWPRWVALAIFVIQETGQPVVAPLHHVLGNAGEIGARQAGHGHSLPGLKPSVDQAFAQPRIGNCP